MASSVVSAMLGRTESPVSVFTRSGITLEVSFQLRDGHPEEVKLRGDARVIYRGTTTSETLEGFDPDFVRDPTARTTVVT